LQPLSKNLPDAQKHKEKPMGNRCGVFVGRARKEGCQNVSGNLARWVQEPSNMLILQLFSFNYQRSWHFQARRMLCRTSRLLLGYANPEQGQSVPKTSLAGFASPTYDSF
jgi:hypothetical protein